MKTTIHGARIHYERSGSGLPLVMLHAGIADSRMWEPQVAAFSEHFDVVRPDRRGFGESTLPPARWSPVADVLALMNELHLKPAHLVGCSIGGRLAIDFALDHPERISKLVLVGPGVGGANFGDRYPDLWKEVSDADEAHDMTALNQAEMHLWLDGPRRPRGYVAQPLRDLFLDMNGRSLQHDHESAATDEIDPPAIGRLHEITAPTLVIVGDEDVPPIMDTIELLMKEIPHAQKAVIHDAAHLPNLEHPTEFNRLVLDFLLER